MDIRKLKCKECIKSCDSCKPLSNQILKSIRLSIKGTDWNKDIHKDSNKLSKELKQLSGVTMKKTKGISKQTPIISKKKRGRPKGSKNKITKQTNTTEAELAAPITEVIQTVSVTPKVIQASDAPRAPTHQSEIIRPEIGQYSVSGSVDNGD